MNHDELIFFNNCKGSDHAKIYDDPQAFYDLGIQGSQASKALGLSVGQICVVCGKPDEHNKVPFDWHSLTEVYEAVDEDMDLDCRVFAGEHLFSESIRKQTAANHSIYRIFFTKNKHFKQAVVLSKLVPIEDRPDFEDPTSALTPEEIVESPARTLPEGALRRITVNAFERSADARKICLDHYGRKCMICGFSFGETYGEFAANYIHVHHLVELSKIGKKYEVDPIKDLRPVCPNCHAAIHIGRKNRTIKEMRGIVGKTV